MDNNISDSANDQNEELLDIQGLGSDHSSEGSSAQEDERILRSEIKRQHSFVEDRFVSERVTVEEAFERVGGFGRFQKFSCAMNTLANMGAVFFLLAFPFLEKEPNFKCQMTEYSDEWTIGTESSPLEDEFCAKEYTCAIDWDNPQSLQNLIAQFDAYCEPKWKIGLMGFSFLFGIVVGCLTVARLGDIYGRKPIYKLGLCMHLGFSICICFLRTHNYVFLYTLLLVFGMSVTARYYVGYSYNIEMQPKTHQPLVSTIQFLSEAVVAIFVCLYFMTLSKNWIYLQIPNIGLTLLGICFLYTMPESPRFLLAQHRYQAARSVFGKIAKFNGLPVDRADYFVFVIPNAANQSLESASPASDQETLASMEEALQVNDPEKVEVGQKPDFMDIWRDPVLRRNLIASICVWACSSFNFFMLTFFMKYFPGNIFENSLCYAFSDLLAFTLCGIIIKYTRVTNGFKLAYLISSFGGLLYILFASIQGLIPVFICLSRIGVTMAFNLGYISVPRLFPTKFQSTVYAVVNLFAHMLACVAPIVAEIPNPVPFIAYLSAIGVSVVACQALTEFEAPESEPVKELQEDGSEEDEQ